MVDSQEWVDLLVPLLPLKIALLYRLMLLCLSTQSLYPLLIAWTHTTTSNKKKNSSKMTTISVRTPGDKPNNSLNRPYWINTMLMLPLCQLILQLTPPILQIWLQISKLPMICKDKNSAVTSPNKETRLDSNSTFRETSSVSLRRKCSWTEPKRSLNLSYQLYQMKLRHLSLLSRKRRKISWSRLEFKRELTPMPRSTINPLATTPQPSKQFWLKQLESSDATQPVCLNAQPPPLTTQTNQYALTNAFATTILSWDSHPPTSLPTQQTQPHQTPQSLLMWPMPQTPQVVTIPSHRLFSMYSIKSSTQPAQLWTTALSHHSSHPLLSILSTKPSLTKLPHPLQQ